MMRLFRRLRFRLKGFLHDLKFRIAERDGIVYRWIVLKLYKPKPGSIEELLDRVSSARSEITLLQIGANDGMTHDPVYRFVKRDRWHAVLLEPQPSVFKRYLKPVYQKYPNAKLVNAAIGYEDGKAELYTIGFSDDRWATGLSRFNKELLLDLINSGRLRKRLHRYGITPPLRSEDWIGSIEIEVKSFQTLLKEHDLDHVDILMMDTEGFDHEVIKMVPFDAIRPTLIVFEDMHIEPSEYQSIRQLLIAEGYQTHRIGPNTVAWQPELTDVVHWTGKADS